MGVYITYDELSNDPTVLKDFGLAPYGTGAFSDSDGVPGNIREMVMFGSNFEDDGGDGFEILNPFITKRFFRHFSDPQGGRGLTFLREFESSPDWALERTVSGTPLNNPLQVYSYASSEKFMGGFRYRQSSQRMLKSS